MPAFSAQRSHSHSKVMDIFQTLGQDRSQSPVHNWMVDPLGLSGAIYTRTSCSDVVLWSSENQVNWMAHLPDLELDVKEP